MHAAVKTLPFGGVGSSGTGSYHGKYSFDAWSHTRAVMVKALSLEAINAVRYPPYTDRKGSIISALTVVQPKGPYDGVRRLMLYGALLTGALALAVRYFPWEVTFKTK